MYSIGNYFHFTHAVGDLDGADAWYRRVLGGHEIERNYIERAGRTSIFFGICGEIWEVLSPTDGPNGPGAVGRFHAKYGDRLHSLSWWVDDLTACVTTFADAGVRTVDVSGATLVPSDVTSDGAAFTHPRDTYGMLEFAGPDCTPHMRMPIEGVPAAQTWRNQGLGLTAIDRSVVVVRDLDAARDLYSALLNATPTGPASERGSVRTQSVSVGTTTVELRAPLSGDSGEARWLEANGEGNYTVVLRVADRARAMAHLDAEKVGYDTLEDGALRLKVDEAFGAPYEFIV